MDPTQCSQFFHDVFVPMEPGKTYYYSIPGGNGTTPSNVQSVRSAPAPGSEDEFTVAVLADMGYTNAAGTHLRLVEAVDELAFVWHGGDISYADQWYGAVLPCDPSWDLCYNGSETKLPGGKVDNPAYLVPLPEGEYPNQGSPQGGDISTVYETNWDLWQQWMGSITRRTHYMVAPGNHEAACAEFDGPHGELSAILDENKAPGQQANKSLSYYSCPPTQRNFTAYQNRFHMPGHAAQNAAPRASGNFWYSFDYGLAHFITLNGETDFANSPEAPFAAQLAKHNASSPSPDDTWITNAGPFGAITGSYKDNTAYEQLAWLRADLAAVDRTKTPWVVALSHRPMYSTEDSGYLKNIRAAFEDILLDGGVDMYIAGHIHWYERLLPLAHGEVQHAAVRDNHTYAATAGSMVHIINGGAGNMESHSQLKPGQAPANITALLDNEHYGFGRLTVHNSSVLGWQYVHGDDGSVGDWLWVVKDQSP